MVTIQMDWERYLPVIHGQRIPSNVSPWRESREYLQMFYLLEGFCKEYPLTAVGSRLCCRWTGNESFRRWTAFRPRDRHRGAREWKHFSTDRDQANTESIWSCCILQRWSAWRWFPLFVPRPCARNRKQFPPSALERRQISCVLCSPWRCWRLCNQNGDRRSTCSVSLASGRRLETITL